MKKHWFAIVVSIMLIVFVLLWCTGCGENDSDVYSVDNTSNTSEVEKNYKIYVGTGDFYTSYFSDSYTIEDNKIKFTPINSGYSEILTDESNCVIFKLK